MPSEGTVIIKKIKKGGKHAHHGGAWKVAYADFVTAMMAFFLLMWLLNATSEEQKRGLSNYFGPVGMISGSDGIGGVLGGLSMATEGSFQSSKASPAITQSTMVVQQNANKSEKGKRVDELAKLLIEELQNQPDKLSEGQDKIEQLLTEYDKEVFAQTEEGLRKSIDEDDDEEIKGLEDHILIDYTPEGLRIQLVDRENKSMFPSGSSQMHAYTKKLLKKVAEILKSRPNHIFISGHTDSEPYSSRNGYSNWELSTDRANACRRALLEQGLGESRIAYVVGKSDKDPLIITDPLSPQNRRISIVLMRTDRGAGAPGVVETSTKLSALPSSALSSKG